MRYAKKVMGERQQYNIKEASSFEQQQKEVKLIAKLDQKLLKTQTSKPKLEIKVRKKNSFENCLKELMKMSEPDTDRKRDSQRKSKKSGSNKKSKSKSKSEASSAKSETKPKIKLDS